MIKQPPFDAQSEAMKGTESLRRRSASMPADSRTTVPLRLLLRLFDIPVLSSEMFLVWLIDWMGACFLISGTQSSALTNARRGNSRAVMKRHSCSPSELVFAGESEGAGFVWSWANVNIRSYLKPVLSISEAGSSIPRHDLIG